MILDPVQVLILPSAIIMWAGSSKHVYSLVFLMHACTHSHTHAPPLLFLWRTLISVLDTDSVTFWAISKLFSMIALFTTLNQGLQTLTGTVVVCWATHLSEGKVASRRDCNLYSPNDLWCHVSFHVHIGISRYFLEKHFNSFLVIELFALRMLHYKNFLYTLDTKPLLDMQLAHVLSHSLGLSFFNFLNSLL